MTAASAQDRRVLRVQLLDAYRAVLTARQREALRLHLEEDWSVTELADSFGISRAAAHDLLRRGMAKIEQMEEMLGLCRRLDAADRRRAELEQQLQRLEDRLRRTDSREVAHV